MDLLYQRYASPFSLIDGMLIAGRFDAFVIEFVDAINKERKAKADEEIARLQWEHWLIRIHDMTFDEYRKSIHETQELQEMSAKQIETTVQDALNILKNFTPNKEDGG